MEKATFAAGCFWGVEYKFGKIPGVLKTAVGYEGGHKDNATYGDVCEGDTGHAEVVELEFDSDRVSYVELVRFFFKLHDPTQMNRQGPDHGTQYRSAIFYHSLKQKEVAEWVRDELNAAQYKGRIVTQIVPAAIFWSAEEYHQKYAEKHPGHHCAL
jgi:methionine-S-sulfoxide reductase